MALVEGGSTSARRRSRAGGIRRVEPEDGELFLTRTLTADGRSGARINARPVPLSVLRAVAAGLVTVHGQQDTQSIRSNPSSFHARRIRRQCGRPRRYDGARRDYVEKKQRGYAARRRAGQRARAEILAFQSAELTAAGVKKGEEDALLEERSRLVNVRRSRCWPTPPATRSPAARRVRAVRVGGGRAREAGGLPSPPSNRWLSGSRARCTSWRTSPNRCAITAKPRSGRAARQARAALVRHPGTAQKYRTDADGLPAAG
ncbi:MAG: hypothetical protein ACLUFV_06000 [Acutalibacteraceae bacterium]